VDPADGPALGDLLEVYRRHGFDSGYHQALRDQLEGLVSHAERYLLRRERLAEKAKAAGEPIAPLSDRNLIYGFVALLESALARQSPLEQASHPQFIGGLGI
jgi:hypothetical protein